MSENVRRARVKAFRYASAASLRQRLGTANLLTPAQKVFANVRLYVRPPEHACPEMTPGHRVQVVLLPEGGGDVVDGMQVVGCVDAEEMVLLEPFLDAAMGVLDVEVDEVSEFDGGFSVTPMIDEEEDSDGRRP